MMIKDQEAIMRALKNYLLAKDAYNKGTTAETAAAYATADKDLRETYKYIYISSLA